MADNVELDAGSGGATVATDDIGGIQHQRVKVQYGVDGSATDVSDTNPLPIDDAGGSITVDAAELTAIEAAVEAIQTAVELLDDAVSGTELQVDVVAGLPAGTNNIGDVDVASSVLPSGAATSAKQDTAQTALSAIQTAVETLDNAISGSEMQVDVLSIAAGDNNIGNVDVASSVLPSGAATSANQDTANTSLAAIETAVELIDNAISGSEMQVDVVAALPAGSNTVGNVAIATRTTGGLSKFRSLDVDETEEAVKASAGQLYGWYISNSGSAAAFVKIYDATEANVSVGSTAPAHTIMIPAGSAANAFTDIGIDFDNAITIAATTGVADSDTTGPGANEVVANLWYA